MQAAPDADAPQGIIHIGTPCCSLQTLLSRTPSHPQDDFINVCVGRWVDVVCKFLQQRILVARCAGGQRRHKRLVRRFVIREQVGCNGCAGG